MRTSSRTGVRPAIEEENHVRTVYVIAGLLGALAVASNVRAQSGASCSLQPVAGVERTLTSGGRPRSYRLFVPAGFEARGRLPLVIEMHGSGGTAAGQAKTSGLDRLAPSEGFVVASLQADGGRWNVPVADGRPDDVAYVSDVIDHVAAQVCIDEARVYATGFSGGGRMASLLACRLNSRIAAVAPMAALRWPGPCEGRRIPVLAFHGLADRQNPYDGNAAGRGAEWLESVPEALAGWARHNGCDGDATLDDPPGPLSTLRYDGCDDGTEVRLIRIDGLGHTWARQEIDATREMWEFFKRYEVRSPK